MVILNHLAHLLCHFFICFWEVQKDYNNLPRYVGVTGYNLGTLQRLIEAAPLGSIDTVSINKWHLTQFVTLYQLTIYADFSFISTQSRQYLHNPKIGSAWCASCALLTFKRPFRALKRYLRRCIKKQQIFYGQADRRGGAGKVKPFGPYHKQMWKFRSIFSLKTWFFDAQNTFYLNVKILKNAFFMPVLWLSKWVAGLLQMIIWRTATV